jgi:hypothetical protein
MTVFHKILCRVETPGCLRAFASSDDFAFKEFSMRAFFVVALVLAASSEAVFANSQGLQRPAATAYETCISKSIRGGDDGRREPQAIVAEAEKSCHSRLDAYIKEYSREPVLCSDNIDNDDIGQKTKLPDKVVAQCFSGLLNAMREHRISRLKTFRDNKIAY